MHKNIHNCAKNMLNCAKDIEFELWTNFYKLLYTNWHGRERLFVPKVNKN